MLQNKGIPPFGQAPFGSPPPNFLGSMAFPMPTPSTRRSNDESQAIFIFDSLDQAALAAARIKSDNIAENSLYKLEGKFYLAIDNSQEEKLSAAGRNILNEHGKSFSAREMSKLYLQEHGEIIIKENAVNILTTYLN